MPFCFGFESFWFFLYIPLVSDYFMKIMHNLQMYNSQLVKLMIKVIYEETKRLTVNIQTRVLVVVDGVLGRFALQGRERKPKETL